MITIFADGLFTDIGESSIKFTRTGKPTGDRYRYLDDERDEGKMYVKESAIEGAVVVKKEK